MQDANVSLLPQDVCKLGLIYSEIAVMFIELVMLIYTGMLQHARKQIAVTRQFEVASIFSYVTMFAVQNYLRSAYKFMRIWKINLLRSEKFIFLPLTQPTGCMIRCGGSFFWGGGDGWGCR